jgi:hypothetical protein
MEKLGRPEGLSRYAKHPKSNRPGPSFKTLSSRVVCPMAVASPRVSILANARHRRVDGSRKRGQTDDS